MDKLRSLSLLVALLLFAGSLIGQTSTFTYQGRLTDTGSNANGSYDFTFQLWDGPTGGTQIGSDLVKTGVTVASGVFSVQLDFGSSAFTPGAARYLQIQTRPAGTGSYTPLTPRQQITSSPFAIRSTSAANSDQLGGVSGAGYLLTGGGTITGNLTVNGTINGNGSGLSNVTAVGVTTAGSDPTCNAGAVGRVYFNPATSILKNCTGSTWQDTTPTATYYVFAYDTTTQQLDAAHANSFQDITFNTNAQLSGWTHPAGTALFTCTQNGLYSIEYSATVRNTSLDVELRATLNNNEIAGSQVHEYNAPGGAVSKSFIASISAGDILSIQFTSNGQSGTTYVTQTGVGNLRATTPTSASITIVRIQ